MSHLLRKPAPGFTAPAVHHLEFRPVSLQDYKGKYVVLFFYPLDFTRVCASEIIEISKNLDKFAIRNCEVVGVSCDSHFTHLAWIKQLMVENKSDNAEITVPLLSDKTGKIADDYGVYNHDQGVSLRAFFIIDKNQMIQEISINDRSVARSVDEVLRFLDALQCIDKEDQAFTDPPGKRVLKRPLDHKDSNETEIKTIKLSDMVYA